MKSFILKPSVLRSVLFVVIALLIGLGVAYTAFIISGYSEIRLENNEVEMKELTVDENGTLSGKFRSKKTGRPISSIEYSIDDDELYITVIATNGEKKALETDEDGFVTLTISELPEIEEFFYKNAEDEKSLTVSRS